MKQWMIETPSETTGARADSQWQSVKSDVVRVDYGALVFRDYGKDGEPRLILAPGTWLSVHPDEEES